MHPTVRSAAETEVALLGVLLSAGTAREGANALLQAMAPSLDDATAALAVRDRDGITLQVLAEIGAPHHWPTLLAPQLAMGMNPAVDPGTSVMVVPLRASGRAVGALLLADAQHASRLLQDELVGVCLETGAAVLHALISRTDAELRRRALTLRSVDAIVDGMAHQIANPLTGASAIAQLLMEDLSDEGQRAAVQQIRQELTRAFAVLHDLLDFHRDTHAQDGILDLTAFVDRILRFRGYPIREQGIALTFSAGEGFMPVRADARGLEHALLIALRFAELRSHGTVNRSINVRVCDRGRDDVAIEITDSGPGDVPEVAAAYFDLPLMGAEYPGRQLAEEQPDLGLVDSILRGCGGRIEVHGSKSAGTSVVLALPRASTPAYNSQIRISS
jgi:signal transduction histidine kinase